MMVELTMQVSRGEGNRLTGTVRRGKYADARGFSGTLELMRVFEELVPVDPGASVPVDPGASSGGRSGRPAVPESSEYYPTTSHSSGER
jgi:hypothetical protein